MLTKSWRSNILFPTIPQKRTLFQNLKPKHFSQNLHTGQIELLSNHHRIESLETDSESINFLPISLRFCIAAAIFQTTLSIVLIHLICSLIIAVHNHLRQSRMKVLDKKMNICNYLQGSQPGYLAPRSFFTIYIFTVRREPNMNKVIVTAS